MALQKNNYDDIISLGTDCVPGINIKSYHLSKEPFPIFNDVYINPKIILDCLYDNFEKYTTIDQDMKYKDDIIYEYLDMHEEYTVRKNHYNQYGMLFLYQQKMTKDELKDLLEIQVARFKKKLSLNKLLFIYTTEDSLQLKSAFDNQETNYNYLLKIEEYLEKNYPKLEFHILAFHILKNFKNTKHIFNFNTFANKDKIKEKDINMDNLIWFRDIINEVIGKLIV